VIYCSSTYLHTYFQPTIFLPIRTSFTKIHRIFHATSSIRLSRIFFCHHASPLRPSLAPLQYRTLTILFSSLTHFPPLTQSVPMPLSLSHIPDPALRTTLRRHRQKQTAAITSADLHEQFLTPTVLGHLTSTTIPTKRISQATIAAQLTTNEAQKSFKYDLPHLGEYTNDYTRSGSLLLLAGRKGDVQIRDWRTGWKGGSVQIGETVRDCK